jgi:hypothetical protein
MSRENVEIVRRVYEALSPPVRDHRLCEFDKAWNPGFISVCWRSGSAIAVISARFGGAAGYQ